MTREQIESALDAGELYVRPYGRLVKWYQARRNGRTKLWKTRPNHWEIPFKFSFNGTGRVGHYNANPETFRIGGRGQ